MGKANRLVVARFKFEESQNDAIGRALANPNQSKRSLDKILVRWEAK